jgi:hypothetical protein
MWNVTSPSSGERCHRQIQQYDDPHASVGGDEDGGRDAGDNRSDESDECDVVASGGTVA